MEEGWIYPPSEGGLRIFGFRVKVWWGGTQVVAAASYPIKSPQLQHHLGGDVEKLVGVVWFLWTFLIWGEGGFLRIVMELHRRLFLLPRLWETGTDVVFLTRSTTSHSHPTTPGRRRRAVNTVWRLKTKDVSRILL
jgi:hypothetical protein